VRACIDDILFYVCCTYRNFINHVYWRDSRGRVRFSLPFVCVCVLVCFFARHLKNLCRYDHRIWQGNVPRGVLETHLFWVTSHKNIAAVGLICSLVSAGLLQFAFLFIFMLLVAVCFALSFYVFAVSYIVSGSVLVLSSPTFSPIEPSSPTIALFTEARPSWATVSTEYWTLARWHSSVKTRSSAIAEGPRDALCQLKLCQLLRNCTKTLFKNACNRWVMLKVTQGHRNCRYYIHNSTSF